MKSGEKVYGAMRRATPRACSAPRAQAMPPMAARSRRVAALTQLALAGKGQMPPQGGGDASEYEIDRAVVYLPTRAAPVRRFGAAGGDRRDAHHDRGGDGCRCRTAYRGRADGGGAPMADPMRQDDVAMPALTAGKDTTPAADPARRPRSRQQPPHAALTAPAAATAAPALYAQNCSTCPTPGMTRAQGRRKAAGGANRPSLDRCTPTPRARAIAAKGVRPQRRRRQAVVTYWQRLNIAGRPREARSRPGRALGGSRAEPVAEALDQRVKRSFQESRRRVRTGRWRVM